MTLQRTVGIGLGLTVGMALGYGVRPSAQIAGETPQVASAAPKVELPSSYNFIITAENNRVKLVLPTPNGDNFVEDPEIHVSLRKTLLVFQPWSREQGTVIGPGTSEIKRGPEGRLPAFAFRVPDSIPRQVLAPEVERVFVTGTVQRPGEYRLQPRMTADDLLKAAGLARTRPNQTAVLSRIENSKPVPVLATDVLRPYDVLVVTLKAANE